ncbi:putative phosphate/phosphonate ABC transporter permease, partial [Haloferax sp. BAB-2207]
MQSESDCCFSIVVLVLFAWFFTNALSEVGFSIGEIVEYWPEFTDALGDFFPPGTLFGVIPFVDVSQYWAFIQERNLLLQFQDGNPVLGAVFVTFAMGFAGTVLGIPRRAHPRGARLRARDAVPLQLHLPRDDERHPRHPGAGVGAHLHPSRRRLAVHGDARHRDRHDGEPRSPVHGRPRRSRGRTDRGHRVDRREQPPEGRLRDALAGLYALHRVDDVHPRNQRPHRRHDGTHRRRRPRTGASDPARSVPVHEHDGDDSRHLHARRLRRVREPAGPVVHPRQRGRDEPAQTHRRVPAADGPLHLGVGVRPLGDAPAVRFLSLPRVSQRRPCRRRRLPPRGRVSPLRRPPAPRSEVTETGLSVRGV